jgi:formin 2
MVGVAGWLALLLSPRHSQSAGPHGSAEDSPLSPARGMPRLRCPLTATRAPPLLLFSSSSPPLPPPSSPSPFASPPPPATSRWLCPRPEPGQPPPAGLSLPPTPHPALRLPPPPLPQVCPRAPPSPGFRLLTPPPPDLGAESPALGLPRPQSSSVPVLSCRHLRPADTLFLGGALDFASSPPAPRSLHPGAVAAARPREEGEEDARGGGVGSGERPCAPRPPPGPLRTGSGPLPSVPSPLFIFFCHLRKSAGALQG